MWYEKKGQPRLPSNTDGVIIASHLLMAPHSVGEDAIFVTNWARKRKTKKDRKKQQQT